jgi:hypothetical protein
MVGAAVLGLAWTGCEPQDVSPPSTSLALRSALKQMTLDHKPGIAIRLTRDQRVRHCPGHILVRLLDENIPGINEMFAEIVFVCLESDVIEDQLIGADPAHTVLLFDTNGRVEGGFCLDFSDAEEVDRFPLRVVRLARGPGDARLKARAKALRRTTHPDLLRALDRLGKDEKTLALDKTALLAEAGRIVPLLVEARLAASAMPRQDELRGVIDLYFLTSDPSRSGPRIPLGVEAAFSAPGGSNLCEERGPDSDSADCRKVGGRRSARIFVKYLVQ